VSALAENVGLERTQLYGRLKQLGIRGNGGG
jgi:transcriptional regulator of acetoin/glycerol metabolism